jgi:PhnB protein
MHASPYLYFNGNCAQAFAFYADAIGAKIGVMMPFAGSPAEAGSPPDWKDKILHAQLDIGATHILASDAPPGHFEKGQGYCVTLDVDTSADAERIFKALSEGGSVRMPLSETFFASRFGMLNDRFGISWMVISAPGT